MADEKDRLGDKLRDKERGEEEKYFREREKALLEKLRQKKADERGAIQKEINEGLVGEELEVIVTGWGKHPGMQSGRTSCHRIVHFQTGSEPAALGQMTRVRVQSALTRVVAANGASIKDILVEIVTSPSFLERSVVELEGGAE